MPVNIIPYKYEPTIDELVKLEDNSVAVFYDGNRLELELKLNGKYIRDYGNRFFDFPGETLPDEIRYSNDRYNATFDYLRKLLKEEKELVEYIEKRAELHTNHHSIALIDAQYSLPKLDEWVQVRDETYLWKCLALTEEKYLQEQKLDSDWFTQAYERISEYLLSRKPYFDSYEGASGRVDKYYQTLQNILSRLNYLAKHPEEVKSYELEHSANKRENCPLGEQVYARDADFKSTEAKAKQSKEIEDLMRRIKEHDAPYQPDSPNTYRKNHSSLWQPIGTPKVQHNQMELDEKTVVCDTSPKMRS